MTYEYEPVVWSKSSGQAVETVEGNGRFTRLATAAGILVASVAFAGPSFSHASAESTNKITTAKQAVIKDGTLNVNGRPFFIESIYRPCSGDVDQAWRDLGINTVIESSCGESDFRKLAKIALAHNIFVIGTYGNGDTLANIPNLIGENLVDEPEDIGVGRSAQPPFVWTAADAQKNNPDNLPIFQNFTPHFAYDQSPPAGSKDVYQAYVKDINAISFDNYYWNYYSCHDILRANTVFYETRDLIKLAGGTRLPTVFVETNRINYTSCPNPVTPTRVHNQIMQAIAGGAKGINLFTPNFPDPTPTNPNPFNTYSISQDIADSIKTTFSSIGPLKQIVLEGVPIKFSNDPSNQIVYGSWLYNGKLYVEAVNTEESPANGVINLPKLAGKLTLTPTLGPLESRLYTLKTTK